jgi:hypothetical protein
VLTDAQARLPGPLQSGGSAPKLLDIPNPDIAFPSLEVNAMLTVRFAPTTAETLAAEGVATTRLLLPVGPPLPPIGLPVGPPPVPLVPPPGMMVPVLLPVELEPQPETSSSAQAFMSSER